MERAVELAPTSKAQNQAKIEEAFKRLEKAIYPSDARLFHSLTLRDVWDAARSVESEQAARKSLRNMRRIQPLLYTLGKFSGAAETLCQGTPYLCFIWVCNLCQRGNESLTYIYLDRRP